MITKKEIACYRTSYDLDDWREYFEGKKSPAVVMALGACASPLDSIRSRRPGSWIT